MRKEQQRSLLMENELDNSSKQAVISMFKESVDETCEIQSISVNDGKTIIVGNVSLEIKYQITINNNENESFCNLWLSDNQIELTEAVVNIMSKLYFFYQNELKKYIRENII